MKLTDVPDGRSVTHKALFRWPILRYCDKKNTALCFGRHCPIVKKEIA